MSLSLPPSLYKALDGTDGYTLPGQPFPVSLTDEEGKLLAEKIAARALVSGFEVATGFGMSSLWAGLAFRETGGVLASIDTYVEAATQNYEQYQAPAIVWEPRGLLFATQWRDKLKLPIRYAIAESPRDVGAVLDGRILDYALIDGFHYQNQPRLDTEAALSHFGPRGVLAFHDTQIREVAEVIEWAAGKTGGAVEVCETRNRLVFVEWGWEK